MARPVLALVGPTASGKTEAALVLAERLHAEIVSCDAMLFYRGMDVGTAKPSAEERARIPHHLIDVADPTEPFSVARYQELAVRSLREIEAGGRVALLAGGSGLYFRAAVDGLRFPATDPATRRLLEIEGGAVGAEALHDRLASFDPEAAARIGPANLRRTVRALEVAAITGRRFSEHSRAWDEYRPEMVRASGIDLPREVLHRRIERRARAMFAGGLLEETRALMDSGRTPFLTAFQAIGYAEAVAHLHGHIGLDEAVARTVRRTKALARRQLAWFRRDPRVRWFRADEAGAVGVVDRIAEYLAARREPVEA
jgi:tRNA dimethylallyltransferase